MNLRLTLQFVLPCAAALVLLPAGCNPSSTVDAAEDPTAPEDPETPTEAAFVVSGVAFNRSLPDRDVEDPLTGCTPGDQRLTAQQLTGTASLALDVGGHFGLNRIEVVSGVYDFAIQLRDPLNCLPVQGAVSPDLRVEFELVYTGAVEDFGDGLCVTASKVVFSSFVFSGAPSLDGWIEAAVKDQVLRSLDMTHLDLLPTATLTPGTDGRCSNWDPLD